MATEDPKRLWAWHELPADALELGESMTGMKGWRVISTAEDPIELLRAVHAFIGYQAYVPDLVDRVWKLLERFPVEDESTKAKER